MRSYAPDEGRAISTESKSHRCFLISTACAPNASAERIVKPRLRESSTPSRCSMTAMLADGAARVIADESWVFVGSALDFGELSRVADGNLRPREGTLAKELENFSCGTGFQPVRAMLERIGARKTTIPIV